MNIPEIRFSLANQGTDHRGLSPIVRLMGDPIYLRRPDGRGPECNLSRPDHKASPAA